MIRIPLRNSAVTVSTMAMLLLGPVAGTQNTSAQQLTAADLSAVTQSTASDNDALLLALFAGYELPQPGVPAQTISYSSTATDSTWANWTAALSGNYFGQTLNLAYVNGTGTADTVSWETTGTFGGASVTGGGTSTISYSTSSSFDMTLSDTLVYGGNTYALNYSDIPGSILTDGDIMFGSPGNEEVGNGTLTLNGEPFGDPFCSYYGVRTGTVLTLSLSDICWGLSIAPALNNYYDSSGAVIKGKIITPEPSTFALLGVSALSLLAYAGRRAKA